MELNVVVEKQKSRLSKPKIVERIKKFHELGYQVLALNVIIGPEQTSQIPDPPDIHPSDVGIKNIEIYTRLTVSVEDTIHTHRISKSNAAKKYDILAIQPLNDKMLNQICGGNFECDIITFDFSVDRLPMSLHKANFNLPISSGTCIEIKYGETVIAQQARINTIAHGQLLATKTKQKNIILGNGSTDIYSFCCPKEVSSLGLFFGLKENIANQAVYRNAAMVIKHGRIRKNKNCQAVEIDAKLTATESWVNDALIPLASSSKQSSSSEMATKGKQEKPIKTEQSTSRMKVNITQGGERESLNESPAPKQNNHAKVSSQEPPSHSGVALVESSASPAKRIKVG